MKIAVRLDDITPDMDWERFFAFKKLLDQFGIKPLIGVVPDNQDETIDGKEETRHPEFWSYLKELEATGWIIAMHGYQHQYTTQKGGIFPLNGFSEFAGVSYEKQLQMLTDGRHLLEQHGILTKLFMAPAHSFDRNTLKALKTAGFMGLTDGFGIMPYIWKDLTFYPISFHMKKTLQQKKGYSTLVIHTGTVSESDLLKYQNYFETPGAEWISYGDYLLVTPHQRTIIGRLGEWMRAKGKSTLSAAMRFLKGK